MSVVKHVYSVEEVFSGRLLRVPDYQRGYAWEDEQLNDFLEDLALLGEGKEHYTGTLVLHPRAVGGQLTDSKGRRYSVVDIVDGQQRLTTIVLLLDSIRRQLLALGQLGSLAEGISDNYISVQDLSGQPLLRLQLSQDTNDFWRDEVVAETALGSAATIASHRRLASAQQLFSSYLAEGGKEGQDRANWLLRLYEKVTHRLMLTLYEVSEAAEVGVIFEVMNDRGKPLTELEKVKNYLLYVASRLDVPGEALGQEVNGAWAHIFETLMEAGVASDSHENALLRAHWLVNYDASPASWDGAKAIKRRFGLRAYADRHAELLDALLSYARSLRIAASAYVDVQVPQRSGAFAAFPGTDGEKRKLRRMADKLRRLRLTATFTPLLIACRLARPQDLKGYADLTETAERYAFLVYRLLERRSDAGLSSLVRLGFELVHGESLEVVLERFEGLLHYYAPANRVHDAFKLEAERNWYWWRGLRYMLYEYEEALAKGDYVPLSWDSIESQELEKTIEHILPQTPKDPYWLTRFSEEERKRLTHDLGNLVLTQHNAALSNRPFPDKRGEPAGSAASYCGSSIFQERRLCDVDEWTPEAVLSRRAALIDWAIERWRIADTEPAPTSIDVGELAAADAEGPDAQFADPMLSADASRGE